MPIKFSFDELVDKLTIRLTENLPGSVAHEPLRAVAIGDIKPKFDHQLPPRPGSVLILIYPESGEILFPLTQRPQYVGTHSGQISLPGGKAEEGEDFLATALREAEEEIGVVASQIKFIGKLSEFFVIPSNFLVTPIVGISKNKPDFKADSFEVEKIIMGNLYDLIGDDAIKTKEILAAGRYPLLAPHFIVEGNLVWGATAMMLNELRMVVRECFSMQG